MVGKWIGGLLLLLGLVSAAPAAVINGSANARGTLAAAQTAQGVSANQVDFGASWRGRWLYVDYLNTAGTATVHLEVNCAPAGASDFASRWVVVPGSSKALTVSVDAVSVDQPACQYRTVIDTGTCASCSVSTRYLAGPELY